MKLILLSLFYLFLSQEKYSFDDYNINCCDFERSDSIELDSIPEVPEIRNSVTSQWNSESKPFACHYIIVQWGCGTGCQMNAIYDLIDGKLNKTFNSTNGIEFNGNSKLIRINADPKWSLEAAFYVFEEDDLVKLPNNP